MPWTNNCIHIKKWYVFIHLCPKFGAQSSWTAIEVKAGMNSYIPHKQWVWLPMHALILVNLLASVRWDKILDTWFSWWSILMCNKSTSAGTSLEGTPVFAHVTLHRTFNPLGSKCPLVAWCWSSFLRTITFWIIHRFLSLKVLLLYICFSKSTAYDTFQFEKLFWIWWTVLYTIILWQDLGLCCEQTHAAFEVGLSLDQGQGVYSGWSDVVVSSQLRLCYTCIIDVMSIWS